MLNLSNMKTSADKQLELIEFLSPTVQKPLLEKEEILDTSIFSFYHYVLKVAQTFIILDSLIRV